MRPSADHIHRTIHYLPAARLVYLMNTKVGCSTIKASLWQWADKASGVDTFAGRPHDRNQSPFNRGIGQLALDMDNVLGATFFTVVRNPFTRVLSAYLDKVAKEVRDARVWPVAAPDFGFQPEDRPSFGEFLRGLAKSDPGAVDRHFASQAHNTLAQYIEPDFIGHLERFDEVETFLRGQGIDLVQFTPHRTGAAELIGKYYGDEEVGIVRRYYAEDFSRFGYADSPATLEPVRPASSPRIARQKLRDLIRGATPLRGQLAAKSLL